MTWKETYSELSQIYTKTNLDKGLLPFVKKFYLSKFFEQQRNATVDGIVQRIASKKQLNISDTAILCLSVFENEAVYKDFLITLPAKLQTMIEKLLWVESMKDTEVEQLLNENITTPSKYTYSGDKELKNEYYIFSVNVQFINSYPRKNIYTLYLHPQLKKVLMEYYPKPPHFYFIPLDDIPETTHRFTAENLVMHEMPKLLSFSLQDAIKYSARGRPTDASINKLLRTCRLTEFFPVEAEHLGRVRSMLMAGLLYRFKINSISIDSVSVIKDLFTKHYTKLFTSQFVLQQLKGWGYMDSADFNQHAEQAVFEVLKQLNTAKWVSADNLVDYIKCRGLPVKPVTSWALNNRLFFETQAKTITHGYVEKKYAGINSENLVVEPFIKGTVFLLAAYGLIEIAYNDINTREFSNTFFSAYDGLQYFRLTALGAYVLGLTQAYEPAEAQLKNTLQFSEDSLMILAEGEMGVLDVMLSSFAEKAGSNRYNVTHAHFLKDCRTRKDIESKIGLFRKTISAKLPVYWDNQFMLWRQNALKISADHQIKAFKIPVEAKELHRMIAQDAELKQLVMKAEQFYILVQACNETKFKNRMKELGYLVE